MMHLKSMRRCGAERMDSVVGFIIKVALNMLKQTQINGLTWIYLMFVHTFGLMAILHLTSCHWQTLVFSGVLFYMSVLGITAGAHRLWAHKSYKAHGCIRFVLMLWNSIANQGSIYEWSQCHRLHHRYADTDLDPHNIKRGVLYAHMGWQLFLPTPEMQAALERIPCDDLLQDWVVVFQHQFSALLNPFMCFIMPVVVASCLWSEDILIALLVPGCLRYVLSLHATWLANSAVHVHGVKPYNSTICACDSFLVSFFTLGDGYQNWHHQYPHDYAASECDWQYNPTTRFIDFCAYWGLAGKRQRALNLWGQKKWVSRSRSPIHPASVQSNTNFPPAFAIGADM